MENEKIEIEEVDSSGASVEVDENPFTKKRTLSEERFRPRNPIKFPEDVKEEHEEWLETLPPEARAIFRQTVKPLHRGRPHLAQKAFLERVYKETLRQGAKIPSFLPEKMQLDIKNQRREAQERAYHKRRLNVLLNQ